jgi:predicted glycoside hydrolase/deacetylase ChbG (UPF0249 family)
MARCRYWSRGVAFLAVFSALLGCGDDSHHAGANTVQLIVNADDVGGNDIYTDASLDARLAGGVTSLSIIACGWDADRAIALLEEHPDLDVGIHLALNSCTNALTPREVAPSLYNEDGVMWHTEEEVATHVRPEEAKIEWEAQIRRVLDAGLHVSHLDGHMGCYFHSRELFLAALDLAKQFQVPLIASNMHPDIPQEDRDLFLLTSYTGVYRLDGVPETLENRTQAYRQLLGRLSPGIHYIWTHQGRPTPDSEELGDMDLRIDDYDFWTGSAARELLDELGYEMIDCSSLETRFREALASRHQTSP